MDRDVFLNKYWKYYLSLERSFIETIDYVELDEKNFNVFSNKYVMILESVGSEIDLFFKVFCGMNLSERKNIADYYSATQALFSDIDKIEVRVANYEFFFETI